MSQSQSTLSPDHPPASPEVEQVYRAAREIARETGQRPSSAHVLLAMFTVPNLAELLLLDRDVNEETLLAHIGRMEREPADTLDLLAARSREIARGCEAEAVDCLHLLAACCGQPRSFAWRLLERTGLAMDRLAETAQRYATHGVPQRLIRAAAAMRMSDAAVRDTIEYALPALDEARDTAIGLPAVLDETDAELLDAELLDADLLDAHPLDATPPAEAREETVEAPAARATGRHTASAGGVPERRRQQRRRTDQQGGLGGRRQSDAQPSEPPAEPPPDAADPAADFTARAPAAEPAADFTARAPAADSPAEPRAPLAAPGREPLPDDAPSPFVLNREKFPWLTRLGRNLSHLAWLGRFDPVVGRDAEIEQALDVLHKRRSNNPCLVGEPGVGKTAIVEGMAHKLAVEHARRGEAPGAPERVIIQVDVGAIVAGTHLRGALAERLRGLQDEVRRAAGRVVVFIDEIHTLVGAGGNDGADAANELKSALARGEFPCIGATTVDEYRESIEGDPALERRFTAVHVAEPDEATTRAILAGVADRYARHHGVRYRDEALDAAVRLSRRYLHDRCDPDKSLGVLDLAGAVARRRGGEVDRRAVAEVVSRVARVPVEHLLVDDPRRFLDMERHLADGIIGQRHVLGAIAETIRRNLAGFAGGRPIGSFLFLGPTGVGKTEAVKALAHFLFGSRDALVRFDMSEFLESHSVARLIGAPPGYVGHQEGGQLTDRIRRRPYQVVLFDEIEKSHRDVWNILLQILDDGRLTDGRGRTVDFSNTVVVLTSNLGADAFALDSRRIGFAGEGAADRAAQAEQAVQKARRTFPPELWNRIEQRICFHPLARDEVAAVARLQLAERARLLEGERGISFAVDEAAIAALIEKGGYDAAFGARPMRQAIAREVETPLAARILAGEVRRGDRVQVSAADGALVFTIERAA
ncbi:MAG: ATP-dependent Clp protease ATP-binding subunit [bacterium]